MARENILLCEQCGLRWSALPDDYPAVRSEEFLICACGMPLLRKRELHDPEPILLQATRSIPAATHRHEPD